MTKSSTPELIAHIFKELKHTRVQARRLYTSLCKCGSIFMYRHGVIGLPQPVMVR